MEVVNCALLEVCVSKDDSNLKRPAREAPVEVMTFALQHLPSPVANLSTYLRAGSTARGVSAAWCGARCRGARLLPCLKARSPS